MGCMRKRDSPECELVREAGIGVEERMRERERERKVGTAENGYILD